MRSKMVQIRSGANTGRVEKNKGPKVGPYRKAARSNTVFRLMYHSK